jgi:serine phosphatase RsbU (regulator of sigma subunit)
MRAGSWEAGKVKLEGGDLLVAFTDRISEAMNHADDEWGESRAPQHDDMTLIVARVG